MAGAGLSAYSGDLHREFRMEDGTKELLKMLSEVRASRTDCLGRRRPRQASSTDAALFLCSPDYLKQIMSLLFWDK
uniref:Uncharacterized protein n=1 Tax=Oryza meridionalis TaxID=40149 RepID=A0A0E0DXM6_9ORYZ